MFIKNKIMTSWPNLMTIKLYIKWHVEIIKAMYSFMIRLDYN